MNRNVVRSAFVIFLGLFSIACVPAQERRTDLTERDATVISSFQTDLPELFSGSVNPVEKLTRTSDSTEPGEPPIVQTPEQSPMSLSSGSAAPSLDKAEAGADSSTPAIPEVPAAEISSPIVDFTDQPAYTDEAPAPSAAQIMTPTNRLQPPVVVKIATLTATRETESAMPVAITPLPPETTIVPVQETPKAEKPKAELLEFTSPDYGISINDYFIAGKTMAYSFLAEKDRIFSIEISGPGKPARFHLFDRYGNDLVPSDFSGDKLLINIPATGWYRLELENDSTGEVMLNLALPVSIRLTGETPSIRLKEEIELHDHWRFSSEVESGKLLLIHVSAENKSDFKLSIRDLVHNRVITIELSEFVEWISPQGFGNRFMIELENVGAGSLYELVLEQLSSIEI